MMYPSAQKKSQTGKISHKQRTQLLDHNGYDCSLQASHEIERVLSAMDQSNVQQRCYRPTQMMFSHVGDTDNEPVTPKSPKSASLSGNGRSVQRYEDSVDKSQTFSPGNDENSAEVAQEGEVAGNYAHESQNEQSQISILSNTLSLRLQNQQSSLMKNRRPRQSRRKAKEQPVAVANTAKAD